MRKKLTGRRSQKEQSDLLYAQETYNVSYPPFVQRTQGGQNSNRGPSEYKEDTLSLI